MHAGALPLCPSRYELSGRLGVAVVGTGRWGAQLLRVFSSLERARVVAACDVEPNRLQTLPPSVRRESELHRVLNDDAIAAVVIATPPHTHAELTIAALEARKHVFVEKPMATSLGDALRIRAAALAGGCRVMVGLVLHYHPAVRVLAGLVERGTLGTVTQLHSERGGGRRPHAEHPVWWSLAPHDISLARRLFASTATSVDAARVHRDGRETVESQVRFRSGSRASLNLDDLSNRRRRRVVVVGSAGVAVFDDLEPVQKLRIYSLVDASARGELSVLERELEHRVADVPDIDHDEPLRIEAAHFVDSVLDDTPFLTDLDHAVDVVSVLASGQRSMLAGGELVRVADWRANNVAS